jgi:hypothetical protein
MNRDPCLGGVQDGVWPRSVHLTCLRRAEGHASLVDQQADELRSLVRPVQA